MKRLANQYVHLLLGHAACHSHTFSICVHGYKGKIIWNGQRYKRKDHCQIVYLLKIYCTTNSEKTFAYFFLLFEFYTSFSLKIISHKRIFLYSFPFTLKILWKPWENRSEFKWDDISNEMLIFLIPYSISYTQQRICLRNYDFNGGNVYFRY